MNWGERMKTEKATNHFRFLGRGGKDLTDLKTGKPIARRGAIKKVASEIRKRQEDEKASKIAR